MKVIEIDENEVDLRKKRKDEDFEEEKLSKEEREYRSAVSLMESVDCATRYEREVESLRSAVVLFEALGSYKDSAQRKKKCEDLAQKAECEGIEKAYKEAVEFLEGASTKMDYRTAIADFERVSDYKDSAQKIEECKKALGRIETKKVWRNRGIVVLVIAVVAFIFAFTPVGPIVSGMIGSLF